MKGCMILDKEISNRLIRGASRMLHASEQKWKMQWN